MTIVDVAGQKDSLMYVQEALNDDRLRVQSRFSESL